MEKNAARLLSRGLWSEFVNQPQEQAAICSLAGSFFSQNPFVQQAKRLIAYLPMNGEVDPFAFSGVERFAIYIPRVIDAGAMEFVLFRQPTPDSALKYREFSTEGGYAGIAGGSKVAPPLVLPLQESDIVIVPSLALNPEGYRLGRGGGYYDRWRGRLEPALRLALLPDQLSGVDFPGELHDLKVDGAITPSGWRFFSPRMREIVSRSDE